MIILYVSHVLIHCACLFHGVCEMRLFASYLLYHAGIRNQVKTHVHTGMDFHVCET
jgi:hypothetical protein